VKAEKYSGKAESKEATMVAVQQALDAFDFEYPVEISIQHYTGVKKYNAVFAIWSRHVTEEFKRKWPKAYGMLDKDGNTFRRMMYQIILGKTQPIKVGKSILEPRQKDWDDLTTNALKYDFLRRVEEWLLDKGVTVPEPPSEYLNDKRKQAA
jgi:hypothetical protein